MHAVDLKHMSLVEVGHSTRKTFVQTWLDLRASLFENQFRVLLPESKELDVCLL